MTKKITAFLTAILCMASAAALPVSAKTGYTSCEWTERYVDDGYVGGYSLYRAEMQVMFHALVIQSDEQELSKEMFSMYPDFENFQTLEQFEASNIYYASGDRSVFQTSVSGNAYVLSLDEMTAEELEIMGRQIMLDHPGIQDIGLIYYANYSIADLECFISFKTSSPDFVLEEMEVPELEGFEFERFGSDDLYVAFWDGDEPCVNPEFFSIYYAEDMTGLQKMIALNNYMDELALKYSDVFSKIGIPLGVLESGEFDKADSKAPSVWTNAGDPNSDGTVNAADAAEMLVSAAQIGTGVDVAVTSAADVNADGLLNAEDAAAVLSYAAAKGTGADVSWVDILRR